jgi:hypothetical protein
MFEEFVFVVVNLLICVLTACSLIFLGLSLIQYHSTNFPGWRVWFSVPVFLFQPSQQQAPSLSKLQVIWFSVPVFLFQPSQQQAPSLSKLQVI